ncbi:hypothetical protein RCG67_01210 [Kocuria sp. CPCC 205292]|uniref:hypothetical protein n=1 Tax=Kocuria cellulosilytica TaxID=3071451 RepID=UPI0034D522F8
MNPTPDAPRPSDPDEESTQDRSNPASDASDGLADPESAEHFRQAVEHRLSEPAPEASGAEEPAPEEDPDEDNPVSVDNPE